MNLFFDTSALIKFFHEENGSDFVTELITSQHNEIWVLELVKLEFFSSLYRRYRNNEINDLQLTDALSGFEAAIAGYHVELLSQPVLKEAETLIRLYGKSEGFRTLDAMHLGAFVLISDDGWSFVAADRRLCKILQKMDFKIINPLEL